MVSECRRFGEKFVVALFTLLMFHILFLYLNQINIFFFFFACVSYHDDADSGTYCPACPLSDDGFQGVDLEVADRTSGIYYLTANGAN